MNLEDFKKAVKAAKEEKDRQKLEKIKKLNDLRDLAVVRVDDLFNKLQPYIDCCKTEFNLEDYEKVIEYTTPILHSVVGIYWKKDLQDSYIKVNLVKHPDFGDLCFSVTYFNLVNGFERSAPNLKLLVDLFAPERASNVLEELTNDLFKRLKEENLYVEES